MRRISRKPVERCSALHRPPDMEKETAFDSRRHTIEEISTVTRYLQEQGYLSKEDVDYYTTLYDYWLYGGLHQRLSGFQTEVEV